MTRYLHDHKTLDANNKTPRQNRHVRRVRRLQSISRTRTFLSCTGYPCTKRVVFYPV